MIILGTDEAGYGPNLGPLVVSLTVWEADEDNLSALFEPLKKAGIVIGDSKKLYHGGSLVALETGVLVPLRSLKKNVVPIAIYEDDILQRVPSFEKILQQHQVQLLDMQYRSVEPDEFNRLLDRFDSKGSLLSDVTLHLIADRLAQHTQDNVLVLCDKHGGRNRYLDILTVFFPGKFFQVVQESRASSVYRSNSEGGQWEFRFLAKGETHLPIALASMLSKYQREWAMIRFNVFWQSHVPDLQPTAGYPEDAKRFKQQIAAAQKRLGIADESLWRKR
jgi:ribonuclease HII